MREREVVSARVCESVCGRECVCVSCVVESDSANESGGARKLVRLGEQARARHADRDCLRKSETIIVVCLFVFICSCVSQCAERVCGAAVLY